MSIELGKFNTLEVVKQVDFGMYLDGGEEGEILLPSRYVPENCQIGDWLSVFLYLDIDERLIATTLTPFVQVGEFACLEVAWVNEFGAFLNWGLMKDLFVPFSEQKMKMQVGNKYVVHAHLDEESYRIVASAKVDRYLSKEMATYEPGDEVNILIWQKTDLGFKAIIENQYSGLLYEGEIFQPLRTGMKLKAFVKQVREDGKIDLMLQKPGFEKIDDFAKTLLDYIEEHDGRIDLTDKSPAEDIYDTFSVSKKTFKKGVGDLYRKRLIVLHDNSITLAPSKSKGKQ
ncbi:S1-like domain-containing RNA-binding protein [Bacteroides sp.]|uniref:CvfB family protein n=1 Tax=Bacteroides sp. TaxID=29523 RepID=UPI001B45E2B6|nr:S1-like domain-containing RNA-binding protein [Bacteroides sp.]MBP6065078.1 GntR family transcriptional regulator [Bacteroides sp.]MBP6066508.1 GntR family transcriptional regulator [Bacteroides sp.]MBP6935771.1 GntR family transcriptional regulator [Bacteroides sp.]MBP8621337.1 GntR family transcriptional regulator [Bacteroides sp.]MBP9507485.1 GntR family transcriptional regulator [Bacteroides sp.]